MYDTYTIRNEDYCRTVNHAGSRLYSQVGGECAVGLYIIYVHIIITL